MPPRGGAIRVLNVAEKPSVAKSVAEILSREGGGMQTRAGRSRYNRVFEFNYNIGGRACHMLVTSVTGHLMELDFDDRYRKWYSCDPAELFHAPVRKAVPQVPVLCPPLTHFAEQLVRAAPRHVNGGLLRRFRLVQACYWGVLWYLSVRGYGVV